MAFHISIYKFSHFAYSPAECRQGGFRYDIPVYVRKYRKVEV